MLTKTVCYMSLSCTCICVFSLPTTYQHAAYIPLYSKTVRNLIKYVHELHVLQERLRHNVLFITEMNA